jgi:hypothetical protein
MRAVLKVLRDIDEFEPVRGDWRQLDTLLNELWEIGVREGPLPVLFRVFERFPESDGTGVLWSIVHGIEALPYDYAPHLRESLARKPSLMGNLMLERLRRNSVTEPKR